MPGALVGGKLIHTLAVMGGPPCGYQVTSLSHGGVYIFIYIVYIYMYIILDLHKTSGWIFVCLDTSFMQIISFVKKL